MEQTGRVGLYFRGELGLGTDGEHDESGLIYLPNGVVKSVRDVNRMVDQNTRVSHVYERDQRGGWKQVREWTWKQLILDDQ